MGINEEWSAPSAAYGHPMAPPPKPVPPSFTIGGRVVDPHTGQWADQTPAPPRRPPTSSAGAETVVARAFRTAQNVRDQHEKYVESLKRSARDNPDEYRRGLASFDASALDAAEAEFQQRKAQEEARIDSLVKGLAPDGDAASETRRSRYWDGERRRIADAKSPINAMQKAIAEATPEQLAVLVQELPRELELRGLPKTCLDSSVAAVRPELASARANLDALGQAEAVLRQDVGAVRRGVAAGAPADPRTLCDPAKFDPDR